MAKDYYLMLGVRRGAGLQELRDAYVRLAREMHPDRGGRAEAFVGLQQAYAVLRDGHRRRVYDARLSLSAEPEDDETAALRGEAGAARRLSHSSPQSPATLSIARAFSTYAPSYDEVLDWLWRNFDGTEPAKSDPHEELNIVVPISSERARRGGTVRVSVPACRCCPTCRGIGHVGEYDCWRCGAEGCLNGELGVSVSLLPQSMLFREASVPLQFDWIRNTRLTLHLRVTADGSVPS